MKYKYKEYLIVALLAMIALAWITACEDGVSVQDTPPPDS